MDRLYNQKTFSNINMDMRKSGFQKKSVYFLFIVLVIVAMPSCNNQNDVSKLQQRVDSLQVALTNSENDYGQLNEYLNVISDGLDSIALTENDIIMANGESPSLNREQIKRNLSQFREVLKKQREKIENLEKSLSSEKGTNVKLLNIIKTLLLQLDEKDAKIVELQQQLEQNKVSINKLVTQYGQLSHQSDEQLQTIAQQTEVLQQQDKAIYEGYIKMGSKQELKSEGLLQGGIFKKTKVDVSKIDVSQFQPVDIRLTTEIEIPSKNPKILSPMPSNSYELRKDGNSTFLIIVNTEKFWSISKFLIIQTK